MIEIIAKSLKALFVSKGRTLITVFGIAVGIAAVIITISISDMGSTALDHEIDGLGMGGLSVTLNNTSAPLTVKELNDIREISFVRSAMPLIFETSSIRFQNDCCPVYLWGIDQNAESTISLSLLYGRFFNAGDIAGNTKCCLIDEKFAKDRYGTENIVGKKIIINCGSTSDQYNIIGIIRTGSGLLQNVMGSVIPDFVYIPYSTMQENLASRNFTQIVIKTENEDYDTDAGELYRRINRNQSYKDAYAVNNLSKQKENLNSIVRIFSLVLTCVGAISVFVAGMNIMNVMLISVKERTREIGIKKAIGASRRVIVTEFLAESALLSLAGGIIGILIAAGLLYGGGFLFGLTISLRIDIMLLMLLFSVAVGALFGIYPAMQAASLKPIDALRYF